MAIPDDPKLTASSVLDLSARIRRLSLPDRAITEISEYLSDEDIDISEALVEEWFFASEWVTEAGEVIHWDNGDYTKDELLVILNQRQWTTRKRLVTALQSLGWHVPSARNKTDIVEDIDDSMTKRAIGALMDLLRPRLNEDLTRRLPDMLDAVEYKGNQLSRFKRNTYLRKKADLVLALLGEVRQTPQDGQEEGTFVRTGLTLQEMEDSEIWPARKGEGGGFASDKFLAEMWLQIVMYPKEDAWEITVTYLQVYEAEKLEHTTGWPTRSTLKGTSKRSQEVINDLLARKMEYEAFKKMKRQKAALKRKLVSRQPAKKRKK